jgi:hypothetical protein
MIRAGMCSKKLVDEVQKLVTAADQQQLFRFDVKDLFGDWCQAKFCTSVEVNLTRLTGRSSSEHHMTQHLREVSQS